MKFYGVGRLTKDPNTKTFGENSVCEFSVAVNRKVKDKEFTDFYDMECWGRRGDVVQEYFQKGSKILVSGRLKQDTWETDGVKRSKIVCVVEDFEFCDSKPVERSPVERSPVATTVDQFSNDVPF